MVHLTNGDYNWKWYFMRKIVKIWFFISFSINVQYKVIGSGFCDSGCRSTETSNSLYNQPLQKHSLAYLYVISGKTGRNIWLNTRYIDKIRQGKYPYKRTFKQFQSLQITASILFVNFIKTSCGYSLNGIDLSMHFKWVPTIYAFIKEIRRRKHTKTSHKHH